MAKVELKQPIVQEISDYIKDAQSVVLVDYRGLTVEEDTQLRKQMVLLKKTEKRVPITAD